jgi:hypothetical protein
VLVGSYPRVRSGAECRFETILLNIEYPNGFNLKKLSSLFHLHMITPRSILIKLGVPHPMPIIHDVFASQDQPTRSRFLPWPYALRSF